jgi:hypothetical protein
VDLGRRRRLSRRELLAGAAAAGGLGAVGLTAGGEARAATAAQRDADVVRSALAFELLVVFAYRHVLSSGTLGPGAEQSARGILGHEQAHVRALQAELSRLGELTPLGPASVEQADKQLAAHHASASLASVRNELDCLRFLYDVESIAIGVYYRALATLTDPRVMRTGAEIMAAEAQHAVAFGERLHPGKFDRVVPVASVQGKQ